MQKIPTDAQFAPKEPTNSEGKKMPDKRTPDTKPQSLVAQLRVYMQSAVAKMQASWNVPKKDSEGIKISDFKTHSKAACIIRETEWVLSELKQHQKADQDLPISDDALRVIIGKKLAEVSRQVLDLGIQIIRENNFCEIPEGICQNAEFLSMLFVRDPVRYLVFTADGSIYDLDLVCEEGGLYHICKHLSRMSYYPIWDGEMINPLAQIQVLGSNHPKLFVQEMDRATGQKREYESENIIAVYASKPPMTVQESDRRDALRENITLKLATMQQNYQDWENTMDFGSSTKL